MGQLIRFGVSIESKLLADFDKLINKKKYANRSEAIRDLIRNELVGTKWKSGSEETIGTITLVYNHEIRDLSDKLTHLQHNYHGNILSTLHIHLDEHNCLEVLVVKGRGDKVKKIADELIGTKGVKHGKLTMTTTGKELV